MNSKIILLATLVLVITCTAPCSGYRRKNSRRRETHHSTLYKNSNQGHRIDHHPDKNDHHKHDAYNNNVGQTNTHIMQHNNQAAAANDNIQHQGTQSLNNGEFAVGFVKGFAEGLRKQRQKVTTTTPSTTTAIPCQNYPSLTNNNQQQQQGSLQNYPSLANNNPQQQQGSPQVNCLTTTSTNVPLQALDIYVMNTPLQSFNENIKIDPPLQSFNENIKIGPPLQSFNENIKIGTTVQSFNK